MPRKEESGVDGERGGRESRGQKAAETPGYVRV